MTNKAEPRLIPGYLFVRRIGYADGLKQNASCDDFVFVGSKSAGDEDLRLVGIQLHD